MKYYWCVACGYHGVFEFFRERNVKCKSCGYEALTSYNESEWIENGHDQRHQENKADPYYDGHLKHGMSRHATVRTKKPQT